MCSVFLKGMENDLGDLADIVRAGGGGGGGSTGDPALDWQFPSEPTNLPSTLDGFGDPFSILHDPLVNELDLASSILLNGSNSATSLAKMNIGEGGSGGGGGSNFNDQKILGDGLKRPCNIFPRMFQIPNAKMAISPLGNSPMMGASPRGIKSSSLDANDMLKSNSSMGCSIENGSVQISSPRNLGIKRRKSQAKQVVCIPAPAPANSRPSGEVVPSDPWAWRKYGQKPIKGSPYPRSYYRCSSSKGCSARKQVERSRNDPNMLVITYTSEHNHPWPTQRNALAGSTRSQPIKNNAASKNSASNQAPKENDTDNASSVITVGGSTIKEEMGERDKEKPMDIANHEFEHVVDDSYKSTPLDSNQSDDFFADLGELGPDPLNLMFAQCFAAEKSDEERENKALDPFSLFDWSGN